MNEERRLCQESALSRKQVVTPKRLPEQVAVVDQKIEGYLMALDEANRHEPESQSARADVAVALIYNFQDRFKPLCDIQKRMQPGSEEEDAMHLGRSDSI